MWLFSTRHRGADMGNAKLKAVAEFSNSQIASIKQAYIEQNQRVELSGQKAANGSFMEKLADDGHLETVKRWVQQAERDCVIEVRVVAGVETLESTTGVAQATPGTANKGEFILFANRISTHKQAEDAYGYVVCGLGFLPQYLGKQMSAVCMQILRNLSMQQQNYSERTYGFDQNNEATLTSAVMQYLAGLSHLSICPTGLQRREGFQRSLVRKLYSKLEWNSDDIHYLIFKAKQAGIRAAKRQRNKAR